MGRASIMDAFNSAAGFSNQALGYQTEKQKEKNEFELRKNDYDAQAYIQNWIRDNPFQGSENEEGDELAYQNYLGRLKNEAVDKAYADAAGKNTSIYYKEQLNQRRTFAHSTAENYALETADKYRINREWTNLEEDTKRYMEMLKSGDWNAQQVMDAVYNRINLSATKVDVTPEQYNKMRKAAETTAYQIYSTNILDKLDDVNNIDAAMNEVHEAFGFMKPREVKVYDKEELEDVSFKYNERTEEQAWSFDNKDEWDQAIRDKATARIQGEHFAKFSDWQARMERMIIAGDLTGAIREAKAGRSAMDRYYNPNNPEFNNYNRDYRDRSSHFFKASELEGYQKQGDVGKAVALLGAYNFDMFVQPQMPGGDGNTLVGIDKNTGEPIIINIKTLQDAKENFLYYKREAFMHDKRVKGVEDYVSLQLWEAERSEFINTFYEKVRTSLKNVAPNSLDVFDKFRKTETYLNDKNNEFYSDELKNMRDPHLRDLYADRCVKFFESIFFNGITDETTIKQMIREFNGSEIMRYLTELKTSDADPKKQYEQMKAFNDKVMSGEAENILYTIFNPDRLDVNGANKIESHEFRSEAHKIAANNFANEERKQLSWILGIRLENMKMQWMPSNRIQNDVIPKAMFIVGEGKNSQTYYLDYKNGNYVAMRREGDKWVDDKAVPRQLNQREQGQQRVHEMNEVQNVTRTGINPIDGKRIDITKAPPNTTSDYVWRAHQNYVYKDEKYEIDASREWAEYYIELRKNPAVTVEQVVNKGRNPITGDTMDFEKSMPSGFRGQYTDWQKLSYQQKLSEWSKTFIQQIVNSGK